MKELLAAAFLALTVVPLAAAFGMTDHPGKAEAVVTSDEGERGPEIHPWLGRCRPVGQRTAEDGQVWILLECESGAFVAFPVPPPQTEANAAP